MDEEELLTLERTYRQKGFAFVAGVDEAGRGPLAGPVYASACIIPEGVIIPGIRDSKKTTEPQRDKIFQELTSHPKIIYGIGTASVEEIDALNILQATILAMQRAVDALNPQPNILLVDGLKLPHSALPVEKIIRGDGSVYCIGAASILAKVSRDKAMREIDLEYPQYGFVKHKGYGTKAHRQAIEEFGPCIHHRKSFEPIKSFQLRTSV